MLTSQLVNLSCLLSITENSLLKLGVFKDLKAILNFYRIDEENIPLEFKLTFSLAETLCDLRLKGSSRIVILDNIKTTEKYTSLGGYIAMLEGQILNEKQITEYIKHIKNHKKLVVSLDNYTEMREFFNNFEQNNFPSIQEAADNFDTVISKAYSALSSEKREENVGAITKLDLLEDNYESAIEQIKKNYSGENAISTGYPELDKFMRKGFEPGRLYIFAGKSGDGKSTLVLNFLKNQLSKKLHDKKLFDIHLYITLENHIDESLLRLYCCLNKLTTDNVLEKWDTHKNLIMPSIKDAGIESKNIILMYYFHPTSISALDIVSLCEEVKQQYAGKGKLASITVDYLDVSLPP
jgi:replicative DNA helicase